MIANPVDQIDTFESKEKGDKGIYAAIDAAGLANALRGAAISRLRLLAGLSKTPTRELLLGVEPPAYRAATRFLDVINHEARASAFQSIRDAPEAVRVALSAFDTHVPVGLPETAAFPEPLRPHLRRLQPGVVLRYDDWQQLVGLLAAALPGSCECLDLSAAVPPNHQRESSAAALQAKMDELQRRYPPPEDGNTAERSERSFRARRRGSSASGNDEGADRAAGYNTELRALCEQLGLNSGSTHMSAIRALAAYETRVFFLLCEYLCQDRHLRVLLLDRNRVGDAGNAEDGAQALAEGPSTDLAPIHALARMIEANESLWVLHLRENRLGPNGVGIIAKALNRNISLVEVDLSDNELNADPFDGTEGDLQRDADDPVFGPYYQGLEAISEVLKKNKFLRILRLCRNGIHAGDSLVSAAPEDTEAEDIAPNPEESSDSSAENLIKLPEGDSYEQLVSLFQDLPLWKLVEPLRSYHKLEVLDLSGNRLRDTGTRMLAVALAQNHSLKVLDLTDNEIGYNGLRYLASWVLTSTVSVLHTLILRRNALGGKQKKNRPPKQQALAAFAAFAESMRGNRRIRRLVFADNHLGPVLSARLLETIAEAEALEELDFSNNEACGAHPAALDVTAAQHVAAALSQSCSPPPTDIAMENHHPQPKVRTLTKLLFGGNNLCAGGLEVLLPSDSAQTPWSLRELDLSRNSIGDALGPLGRLFASDARGPATFAATLCGLNLSYNEIKSLHELTPGLHAAVVAHAEGASPFALCSLNLSHNRLGCDEHTLALEVSRKSTRPCPNPPVAPPAAPSTASGVVQEAQQQQFLDFAQAISVFALLPSLEALDLSWNSLGPTHGAVFHRLFAPDPSAVPSPSSMTSKGGNAILMSMPLPTAATPTLSSRRPFEKLKKIDLSHNIMTSVRAMREVLTAIAALPGIEVVRLTPSEQGKTTEDVTSLLQGIHTAVLSSATLQDVRCGLHGLEALDPVLQDPDEGATDGVAKVREISATIAAVRDRLLLNALLQATARERA